ncbi:alpha/beta-hydrolase [Polyplosphaeria fusca]|uniref:Alpha/beta-hydrolase n=1 Tax=Polyplosphaeria fusca TaxID=682080 RepID=A0A9P4QTC0_9PLEO|nr:alpha/beta-hydrolase [Polyplosphaeria fusca]
MPAPRPTIVLLHGGWHKPAHYSKLISALKNEGYEVHSPSLPSMNGSRPPNADLTTDTQLVRGYIESLVEAGRTVLVLMHSYGGVVGTNALYGLGRETRSKQGKAGGIAHLIYMCAYALPEGECLISKVKDMGHEALLDVVFDWSSDMLVTHRDPKAGFIGTDFSGTETAVSEAEAKDYVDSLLTWNGKTWHQPSTHAAWREIPVTYLKATKDVTVPLDYQVSMIDLMRKEGTDVKVVEVATGHSPHMTMVKEVVAAVNEDAASV